MLEHMNGFGGIPRPALPGEPWEGLGAALLGKHAQKVGVEPLGLEERHHLERFQKELQGPYGLAEREGPLMVMILTDSTAPAPCTAFTRLKQQLEPVWGEHLFPFQIAS